jgi:hypothetical protein
MAHQSIYPDGGIHKVDFECCRCHCRGFVAPEHLWNFQLPLHDSHLEVSRQLINFMSRGKSP